MHINDYLNQLYNNSRVGYTYHDMDVNNDYIINEKDLALAQDYKLRCAIWDLIEDVDEDSELVFHLDKNDMLTLKEEKKCNTKGLTKEDVFGPDMTELISARDGMNSTNEENFENDVLNSKGVTFVVMGNLGSCSHCNELERALVNFKDELDGVAKIYNMGWTSNTELCRDICYNQGYVKKPAGFPQIAKFVDGKFDSMVESSCSDYHLRTRNGKKIPGVTKPDIIDKLINAAKAPPKNKDSTLITDDNGLYVTNTANFNKNVEQSKGTTYVVMGSLGIHGASGTCWHCHTLYSAISSAQEQLKGVANVFHMAWDNNLDADLCRKICREMGNVPYPATFPQIAKFVDGKFVEMLSNTRDSRLDAAHATVQEMLAKAEGIPSLAGNNNSSTATTESNSSQNSEEQNKINEEKEKLKTEMNELKTQANRKEAEAMFFKSVADKKQAEYKEFSEELLEGKDTDKYLENAKLNALKTSSNAARNLFDKANNELFALKTKYISVSQDYLDL